MAAALLISSRDQAFPFPSILPVIAGFLYLLKMTFCLKLVAIARLILEPPRNFPRQVLALA
jgi:hypothetical protein